MAVSVLAFPSSLPGSHQIIPIAVPTSPEDVVSENVYLDFVQLSNPGAGTITITISGLPG